MTKPVYRRVVVKVSGEALMGPDRFGIHQPTLERIAADLLASRELGVEIAVVVGGGNIFRGVNVSEKGIPRVTGDLMGMLATVMKDRKSTRLNSSHTVISYAVFCLKKKINYESNELLMLQSDRVVVLLQLQLRILPYE